MWSKQNLTGLLQLMAKWMFEYIHTYIQIDIHIQEERREKVCVGVCEKKKKSYCAHVNFYMILLFVCRHSRPLVWDQSTWSRLFPHWSVCGHLQLRQPVWQRLKEKTPAWNGHAVPARYQILSHESLLTFVISTYTELMWTCASKLKYKLEMLKII